MQYNKYIINKIQYNSRNIKIQCFKKVGKPNHVSVTAKLTVGRYATAKLAVGGYAMAKLAAGS